MPEFKDMLKYFRMRENLSQSELAEKLGVSASTISMYEVGKREPDFETEERIADFFNTDLNTLRGRDNESNCINSTSPSLTDKDNKDIAKDLDTILEKLSNSEDGPASYDGEEIPDDDREMFAAQLEIMLRRLKTINKEKYNPNKNKK